MSEDVQVLLAIGFIGVAILVVACWAMTREQPEERILRDYSALVQKLSELEQKQCEECSCRRKEGTCTGTGR